ncbi:protein phosphatase 2C domain-containing protein [Streptomyces griseicoloratus]|uniref:protein phosphatase 2C domain-containing protein n=1 Tax=Streptomyces griseicoloratus TaxID=2752516 RepID=UPI0040385D18
MGAPPDQAGGRGVVPGRVDAGPTAGRAGGDPAGRAGGGSPSGRVGGAGAGPGRAGPSAGRAPWEPPAGAPSGPVTFPPGPRIPRTAEPDSYDGTGQGGGPWPPAGPRIPADPPPPPPPQPPAAPGGEPPSAVEASSEAGFGDPPAAPAGPGAPAAPEVPGRLVPAPRGAEGGPVDGPGPATVPDVSDVPVDFADVESAPDHVGSGPPTYDPEPTALPAADPDGLDELVADTVLDGARYGACTLRAVSVRGDSARYRGDPRRDALLTARFGAGEQALILVAMATGTRGTPGAHRAAAEACQWIGRAVGRSRARLVEDLRAARRGDLKSGLHRLTDRSLGKLRARAAEQGLDPDEYAATLRCLLLPADPRCRTRVFFGAGEGGLFRLRDGAWQDIEPRAGDVTGEPVVGFGSQSSGTPEGDRLTMDLGITTPPGPYEDASPGPPPRPFRFRASVARPGDVLLMCTAGLAEPLAGEPELGGLLARRWSGPTPPGLAAFLADTRVRVKGYADDRTAAAVWEA